MGVENKVWPDGYIIKAWLLLPLRGKKECVVAAEVKGPLCSSRRHPLPLPWQKHPSPGCSTCAAARPRARFDRNTYTWRIKAVSVHPN